MLVPLSQVSSEVMFKAGMLFVELEQEIGEAVRLYWEIAGEILEGSGIRLLELPAELVSLKRNFFSTLFLYSFHRGGIPREQRIFYAAINHCLRGMVTGCDNLLDDEYKATLLTDLPEQGTKFRSVLDIMVSDRVMFEIALRIAQRNGLEMDRVLQASAATLHALTLSGAQEASEEKGAASVLLPEDILKRVHHFKTGLLFQSPWAVPKRIETLDADLTEPIIAALWKIGVGCQIMDDMVDIAPDYRGKHHNYIVSLVIHGDSAEEKAQLEAMRGALSDDPAHPWVDRLPIARDQAAARVKELLREGLEVLFPKDLHELIFPLMWTLSSLIRAVTFVFRDEAPPQ